MNIEKDIFENTFQKINSNKNTKIFFHKPKYVLQKWLLLALVRLSKTSI